MCTVVLYLKIDMKKIVYIEASSSAVGTGPTTTPSREKPADPSINP